MLASSAPAVLANSGSQVLAAATDEVQSVSMTGAPAGGSTDVTWPGYATVNVPFNCTSAVLQGKLDTTFGAGNTHVATGATLPGAPLLIEFKEALGGRSIPLPTVDDTGLTGGTAPHAHVTVTTPYGGDVKLLGENMGRAGLVLSAETADVWVSYGTDPAEVGKGVCIRSSVNAPPFQDHDWRGEVHAIAAGDATLAWTEKLYYRGDDESERPTGSDAFSASGPSDTRIAAPTAPPLGTPYP